MVTLMGGNFNERALYIKEITVTCRFSKKMDRPKPLAKMEKFAITEQLANFKNHEILHLIFENFQMFSTHQIEFCTPYLLSL